MTNKAKSLNHNEESQVVTIVSAPSENDSREERYSSVMKQYKAMLEKQTITRNTSRDRVAAVYD
jgi:hypothetical protein